MNRTYRLCGVLLCAASLSACATVTRGTRQAYVIETDPPGAQVELSTGQTCVTPCALRLPRRPGFTATITREGYETVEATVASGISGGGAAGMAGNVILGGLIGAVVDGSSGAMNDLSPNPLRVSMVRIGGEASVGANEAEAEPAEAPFSALPSDQPAAAQAPAEAAPAAPAPATPESPQGN